MLLFAYQLIRKGRYETVDHKYSRLIFQEVSDFWRVTTSNPINISEKFSKRGFTAALKHLKPDKAPGPDSIYAGTALKS